MPGTQVVKVYPYQYSATQMVYLIDTPGFDDSTRTDTQVLREIASWLSYSYTHEILLHGIIYLHRISDRRMQGSALKNLFTFKRLCGDNALKKVLLVTTMWDDVPQETAEAREKQLIEMPEYWARMIQKGSTTYRHSNTTASARGIIARIVEGDRHAVTLDMQDEMVNQKQDVLDTSACREINKEISAQIAMQQATWRQELEDSREQLLEAIRLKDVETQKEFAEMRAEHQRQIAELEGAREKLRVSAEQLAEERERRQQQANEETKKLKEELQNVRKENREITSVISTVDKPPPYQASSASGGSQAPTSAATTTPITGRWISIDRVFWLSRSGSSLVLVTMNDGM